MDAIREGLLKVDPGLLLWTVITFLVLLLILWKAAWKPIVEALEARSEKVREDIENAEKNRLQAENAFAKHKEMLDNAKEEVERIIADGKADAEKSKRDILDKADNEAMEIVEGAKKEITIAKEKALSELHLEVSTLATDIASKIIAKNLNVKDQESIIENALLEIEGIH